MIRHPMAQNKNDKFSQTGRAVKAKRAVGGATNLRPEKEKLSEKLAPNAAGVDQDTQQIRVNAKENSNSFRATFLHWARKGTEYRIVGLLLVPRRNRLSGQRILQILIKVEGAVAIFNQKFSGPVAEGGG
jgi:hypothetical protein